jgi:hypothetical protein
MRMPPAPSIRSMKNLSSSASMLDEQYEKLSLLDAELQSKGTSTVLFAQLGLVTASGLVTPCIFAKLVVATAFMT